MVASCTWRCYIGFREKPSALFRRQPVPEAHANAAEPFYAADTRSQFEAEETVGTVPYASKAQFGYALALRHLRTSSSN